MEGYTMEKQEIMKILLDKGFKCTPLFGYDAMLIAKNCNGCAIYVDVVKRTPTELAQGLKDRFDFYLKDKNGKLISSVNSRNLDNIEKVIEDFTERAQTLFPIQAEESKPTKKVNVKTIYFDCYCYTTPIEISYYGALKENIPLSIKYSYKYTNSDDTYSSTSSYFWADEYDEDSEDSFELVSAPDIGAELVNNKDVRITFGGFELN